MYVLCRVPKGEKRQFHPGSYAHATFHWLTTGANTRMHNFQDDLSLLSFRYST
jgi:hypothetical protein